MLRATIVCLILAMNAGAQQNVAVEVANGDAPASVSGHVVITPADSEVAISRVPLESGRGTLGLAIGKAYSLELDAPGFWAASEYIVASEQQNIVLRVWKTATLVGQFPRTGDLPAEMKAVVDTPPDATRGAFPRGTTFACDIETSNWRCEIPATPLDVVLRPAGYAPVYIWSIDIRPGQQRDLGVLRLQKGASFVAWLARESAGANAKARLFRQIGLHPSEERARLSVPVAEGTFNSHGHLQLVDLPAEPLTLEVRADGRATEWIGPLEIAPGRETVLRYPITLNPPIELVVQVDPPLDPSGNPWDLTIRRRFTATTPIPIPARSAKTNEAGLAVVAGQSPGAFQVTVSDAAGNRYAARELELTHETGAHQFIRLEAHAVRGTIMRGDKPLAASLIFGGRSGEVSVRVTSSSDGTFSGVLPRAGKWPLSVVAGSLRAELEIEVVVGEPLTVEVPGGQLSGVVVDSEGKPVADAEVRATWAPNGAAAAATDSAGAFLVDGVGTSATVSVRASHRRSSRRSQPISVAMSPEGRADPLRLTLRENRAGRGKVTAAGAAVAGAVVTIQPARGVAVNATTRLDGSFSFALPEGTGELLVYVGSPGKTFQAFRFLSVPDELDLHVAPIGGDLEIVQPTTRWSLQQNGVPVLLPHVLPWAQSADRAPVDPTTPVLRLPKMAPGQYTLCAARSPGDSSPGNSGNCTSGTLGPGATLQLGLK